MSFSRTRLSRSRSGSMPFALVAVTLLLTSSVFCVTYANMDEMEKNADGIAAELNSIDDAISEVERRIEGGLGKIIFEISSVESGENLVERTKRFDSMTEEWMSSAFPMNDKGVMAKILDYDFSVGVQSLKVSSDGFVSDRSAASFLRASGTAKVQITGQSGTTVKTLKITADGTSGLPFILENATKFELSSESDASLLIQLISYQLSSLAQSRIVNGYGLKSISGGKGTHDIITDDDVEQAFRNALSIVETICFRCNDDSVPDMVGKTRVDPSEILILKNGFYEIDMGAMLSQAILSIVDLLVVRWMDYLALDKVMDVVDRVLDVTKELINTIVSFIRQDERHNRNSACVYIEEVMEQNGIDKNSYRFIMNGKSRISVSGDTLTVTSGDGPHQYELDDVEIEVELPNTDVISWEGWKNYVVDYERNRNSLSDYVRKTIVDVCTGMMGGYGVVKVPADKFDDVPFVESFSSAIEGCLSKSLASFSKDLESSVCSDNVTDMLLVSIYGTMCENREGIFREGSFRESIEAQVIDGIVEGARKKGFLYGESLRDAAKRSISGNKDVDGLVKEYTGNVDKTYELYDRTLNAPKSNGTTVLKQLVIEAGKEVMKQDFVKEKVSDITHRMVSDVKEYILMNCDYGVVELSGNNSFVFYDGFGNRYQEYIDLKDSYGLNIDIEDPTENGKNVHSVGLDEIGFATYTSVFTIGLDAKIDYVAHTMSGVDRDLGRYDSSFKGSFDISTVFDISCVSAWSLTGAHYDVSTTIFDDAWKLALKSLEPLLEPLKQMFNEMKRVYNLCNDVLMEISAYATELIDRLYETLMGPLESFMDVATESVLDLICNSLDGFDIGASKQKIVFSFCGLRLTAEFRLATLMKSTKNIVKLTLEGELGDTGFSAFVDIKKNAKNEVLVRGGGEINNDDCSVNIKLDPFLKFGSKLITLNGSVRGVDFNATVPEKVVYDEFEACLSDIPGVGAVLSNIPLPLVGFKGSFDMGVNLKYNLPSATGLVINEFESNPAGQDDGNEWVELYNATGKEIDLSGYMLVPESSESKAKVITGTAIGPFEKKVIVFERKSLNNSKSGTQNGESISLYDPQGEKIDSTPWKKDTYNNDCTWQRKADGSMTWIFVKGTPGGSNGTLIKTNSFAKEFLVDCMLKAADRAFEEMGNHLTNMDEISMFLERTLQLFVKNVVDTIADVLISASVFILFELTDYAQTQHCGLKIAFEMNSDLVREGIYWLLNQVAILKDVVREPSCNDPIEIIRENAYLTTTAYVGISTPKFLTSLDVEEIEIGLKTGVNVSTLSSIANERDEGWKAFLGVVVEDIDPKKLPSRLRSDTDKSCDLWLMKLELNGSRGKA